MIEKDNYQENIATTNSHINIGTGVDVSIKELVELLTNVIGYTGEIRWEQTKPDGTPRKLLDVSKAANLGWQAKTKLEEGLTLTYQAYLNECE
jgi:GDP-L-fucose synthase